MSTRYISRKFKTYSAKRFKESITTDIPGKVGYIFIGKSLEYSDENTVPDIIDTISTEKEVWDNMFAGVKLMPGDIEFVVPRYDWTSNTKYKQYDDIVELDSLLTSSDNISPMYIMNSEGNVYKCISNNNNSESVIEPTGTYLVNDGFIETDDNGDGSGYIWKYLYNVYNTNKFLTSTWIPSPYTNGMNVSSQYDINSSNLIQGSINKIIITNGGTGYYHTTINVNSFLSGSNNLSIIDSVFLPTSNIKINMKVTGEGISPGTYITALNTSENKIILSTNTISPGGNTLNPIQIVTRADVVGDGSQLLSDVAVSNGAVESVNIEIYGKDYTTANIVFYGSGSNASARAILPPKFGHGYNPAVELGSTDILISKKIGEVDASEGGLIPTDTSFRQYGILMNPYKYNDAHPVSYANANTVISQTSNVLVLSGSEYELNETVYQGNMNSPSFSGIVVSQTLDILYLSNIKGSFVPGLVLIGKTTGRVRYPVQMIDPEFEPYAGDIIYTKNINKVARSVSQSEEIKMILQF